MSRSGSTTTAIPILSSGQGREEGDQIAFLQASAAVRFLVVDTHHSRHFFNPQLYSQIIHRGPVRQLNFGDTATGVERQVLPERTEKFHLYFQRMYP